MLVGVKIRSRWHFGFKLHLIINDKGELLAFKLTPGNVDDRKPVPEMTQDIFGKLFGDRGNISQNLFEKLYEQQLQLITRYKKNMKQKLVKLIDKILLRKRALIETVNDQLKNIFQIEVRPRVVLRRKRGVQAFEETSKDSPLGTRTFEHSRHRSIWNFKRESDGWVDCLYLSTKQAFY
ncbi:MAG: IS982 family transposase [Pleurocapsa sp. MO_192.B19]|nr:IS982 family transposase [Pleurocapsa sp. MO_192.B19]